jgi:hypothetical protein
LRTSRSRTSSICAAPVLKPGMFDTVQPRVQRRHVERQSNASRLLDEQHEPGPSEARKQIEEIGAWVSRPIATVNRV